MDSSKNTEMASHWLLGVLGGIISVLIGWYLLATPTITVVILVQVLGFYWIITGVIGIVSSIFGRGEGRGWEFASSTLGLLAGLIVINSPVLSSVVSTAFLVYMLGFLFIFNGVATIFTDDKGHSSFILRLIVGVLSILVGLAMFGNVFFTAKFFVLVIGVLTLVGGISAIITSVMLRVSKNK